MTDPCDYLDEDPYLVAHGRAPGRADKMSDILDAALKVHPWRHREPRNSGFYDTEAELSYCYSDGHDLITELGLVPHQNDRFEDFDADGGWDVPQFCAFGPACINAVQTPHGKIGAMLHVHIEDNIPILSLLTHSANSLEDFYQRAYILAQYLDLVEQAMDEVENDVMNGSLDADTVVCPFEEYVTGIPPQHLPGGAPPAGAPEPAEAEPEETAGASPYESPIARRLAKYKAKGFKLIENPSPEDMDRWIEEGVQNFIDYVLFPLMSKALCNTFDVVKCPCVRYMDFEETVGVVRVIVNHISSDFFDPAMTFDERRRLVEWGLCDFWQAAYGDAYENDPSLREDVTSSVRLLMQSFHLNDLMGTLRLGLTADQKMKPSQQPRNNADHLYKLVQDKARAWQWTPPQSGAFVHVDSGELYCREDGERARSELPPHLADKLKWEILVEDVLPRFCSAGMYCARKLETDAPDIGAPLPTQLIDDGQELYRRLCRWPADATDLMYLRYAMYQYRDSVRTNMIEQLSRGERYCPLWVYVHPWYPRNLDAEAGAAAQVLQGPPPVESAYESPIQRQYEKLKAKGFKLFESAEEEREFHRRMIPNPASHTEDCRPYRTAVSAIADRVMTDPSWRVGQTLDRILEQVGDVLVRLGVGPGAQMELKQDALTCGFTIRPEHVEGETGGDEEQAAVLILTFDIAADVLWKSTGQDRIAFASAIRQAFVGARTLHNNPAADVDEIELARHAIYHCRGDADCALDELLAEGWDIETATFAVRAAAILVSDVAHRWDDTTEDYDEVPEPAAFVDNVGQYQLQTYALDYSEYMLEPHVVVRDLADGSIETIWFPDRMSAERYFREDYETPAGQLQILSIPEALNAEIAIPDEYRKKKRRRRRNPAGGLHEGHAWSEFDPYWLDVGVQTEMEHTSDPAFAREIAADHLVEDPMYYRKLMEAGL